MNESILVGGLIALLTLLAVLLFKLWRQQQQALVLKQQDAAQLRLLQRSVDASLNGIVIADGRQKGFPLVYANAAFERITGYSSAEMLGRNCSILQGEGTDPRAIEQIRQRLAKEKEVHTTIRNYRKDGTPFWNDLYITPVTDQQGVVTHYIGVQNDVTERKEQQEQMAWHATHDSLTRLPNRALLEDRLDQAYRFSRRYHRNLAIMFIDLDGFKPVNDTYGHAVGDALLKAVADRLQQGIRDGDTLARIGGDEFVVVLPNPGSESDINEIAERLLMKVAEPYQEAERQLTLTASIGIAVGDEHTEHPSALIQQADMAMYKAKRRGSNNFEWFTPDINHKVERHVMLRHEIQAALKDEHFSLVYQPIVNADRQPVAVEALLRWHHPTQGMISPLDFISLSEHTGQIIPLGRWVLEQVCKDMQQIQALGYPSVSVNISPLQLSRQRFVQDLQDITSRYQVAPQQLQLEITENVLVSDLTNAPILLHELHKLGFRIAIDDFGTGYSSLRYLQELPISALKIDRDFVCEVGEGGRYEGITRAILALASELNLQVVGEGVERELQRQFLQQHGCNLFQGFLFAKPMPLAQLATFK